MRVTGSITGATQPIVWTFKEDAAQSFVRGDHVRLLEANGKLAITDNTTGNHIVSTATPNDKMDIGVKVDAVGAAVGDTKWLGIALHDASGTTDQDVNVALVYQGCLIEANLLDSADGATPGTLTLLQAHLGARVGILREDTPFWCWTLDETTAAEFCATIVSVDVGVAGEARTGGAVGDVNARVLAVLGGPNITTF